jgi:GT2 family glycosyltransferase
MNSSKPYKVYAIIVTYNGSEWINKCLGSLRESSYPVGCVVIDNNSTDNTVEIILQDFPEVHLIRSKTNLGFGKANNIGIKKALEDGVDYFLLLNQDAWIAPNTVACLLDGITSTPEWGVISPLHYDGSGIDLDFGFNQYLAKQFSQKEIEDFKNQEDDRVRQCDFINAAAWLVSRQCVEIVGGFGYVFYHYGEDRDYVQRMKWLGFKIGFVTTTKIYHDRKYRTKDNSFDYRRKLKYYFVGCLARCTDLNYAFVHTLISSLVWVFKELAVLFVKERNYKAPFLFLSVMTKLLLSILQILKYRAFLRKKLKYVFLDFN